MYSLMNGEFGGEKRMARKTQEEVLKTRMTLLEEGIKLFAKQGFAATSMLEIAEEGGYTRGAIHSHFSSKSDIMAFWHAKYKDVETNFIAEVLNGDQTELEKLIEITKSPLILAKLNPLYKKVLKVLFLDKYSLENWSEYQGQELKEIKSSIQFFEYLFRKIGKKKKVVKGIGRNHFSFFIGNTSLWLDSHISDKEFISSVELQCQMTSEYLD